MNALERYRKIESFLQNSTQLDDFTVWKLRETNNLLSSLLGDGRYGPVTVRTQEETVFENREDGPTKKSVQNIDTNLGVYETAVVLKNHLEDRKESLLNATITLKELL